MTHEKIFERPEGNQVKVSVWLYAKGEQSYWGYVTAFRNNASEPWLSQNELYQRSQMNYSENYPTEEPTLFNHYVNPEEIMEVKYELWESIRPTLV
jgi:hypothetical protein